MARVRVSHDNNEFIRGMKEPRMIVRAHFLLHAAQLAI